MEGWQRLVQSGGQSAERQWGTAQRVERCVTLSSVRAWRGFSAIMWARAVPEMPGDVRWESEEWPALYGALPPGPAPPDSPPSLGEAVRWLAQLGGCVGRRRCDPPGAETLWRGFQPLTDLTRMYRIMRSAPP